MKPIFKEEKDFLERNLSIELPNNCWRSGSKIYLNIDTKPALIEFKVDMGKMYIKKNNIIEIKEKKVIIQNKKEQNEVINLSWEDEFELRKDYLRALEIESIEKTIEFIDLHKGYEQRISISGGKDSDLLYYIMMKVYNQLGYVRNDYIIDIFNTTNDTADTFKHIKNDFPITIKDIHSPEKGWYKWLGEDKNWFLPSTMVRNCCSTYKEGQLKKILDKKKNYILFLGMRKFESAKRSKYDWDLNEAIKKNDSKMKLNVPENWKRFLPIVNFKDEDVWLMLLYNKIKFNYMYRLGFNRTGCLICPFSSGYADMLIRQHYNFLMKRWEFALEQNYNIYNVENRLKWSLEEWMLGKWKQGTSKEYELINLKPTKERIEELAKIKGVSYEIAEKYFQKKCSICGKKLNPDEVAMNLKYYGRSMDLEKLQCKKCFCESNKIDSKKYSEMIMSFRDSGCKLF